MINRRQALGALAVAAAVPGVLARAASERVDRLKVLSYNILEGGNRQPLQQTAKVIVESGADFVGIQEIMASGPKLAELTGMHLFDQGNETTCILSRWPLERATAVKWGARYLVPDRGPVWIFNAHLPSLPYQPYQLARIPYYDEPFISTEAEAIGEALRARAAPLSRLLMEIGPAMAVGEPIVLTGDLNEPSHLDWTERAAEAGRCRLPVAWPTSRAIVDAGLTDAYRTLLPDEVAHPGLTWTPRPAERDVLDRIDFIYTHGLKPTAAAIIGENDQNADVVVDPYPSDHRAVLATVSFA